MLKYRPKRFWGMLKPAHHSTHDLPTAALADLNKKIFFDETISEESYEEIQNKSA
jgi:hypothetical protein